MTQKLFQKCPRVLRLRRDPFSPLPQQAVTWNARSVLNLAKSYWWPHVLARETYRRKDIIQSQAERIQPKSANVLGGPSVPVVPMLQGGPDGQAQGPTGGSSQQVAMHAPLTSTVADHSFEHYREPHMRRNGGGSVRHP